MNNSRTMNSLKNIIAGFGGQFITLLTGFINRIIFFLDTFLFIETYIKI